MKSIVLSGPGNKEALVFTSTEKPVPADQEVLIAVKAIAINPVDVKTRLGKGVYGRIKEQQPLILGWDIAGVIEETGKNVRKLKKGDRVFGMVNFPGHGKAYAEYVTAPEAHLSLIPANIDFEQAAATTLAALTAYQALVTHAKVQAGQKVLIHAAAGGVGHFAVQIAKHLGAAVTGTSSPQNKDFVLSLGAENHIDYHDYDWSSHPEQFDFVLDAIGGDNIDKSLLVTKAGGTLISIPTGLSETVTEKAKEKSVNGYFMLVQSSGTDMQALANWLEAGILKPYIGKQFSFDQMPLAHELQESGHAKGKLVIRV